MKSEKLKPKFNDGFQVIEISKKLTWDDLDVSIKVRRQMEEILQSTKTLGKLDDSSIMPRRVSQGYKILFHGASGTNKTVAAILLAKYLGSPVFRVDLSKMISKFIGETEKNLSVIFQKAKEEKGILFFDEGDAIFGRRSEVKEARDRYANQEVSYLLQRMEGFRGLVILSVKNKSDIEPAFLRRFQSTIGFSPQSKIQKA